MRPLSVGFTHWWLSYTRLALTHACTIYAWRVSLSTRPRLRFPIMSRQRKPDPTHILSFTTNSLRNTTASVDDDTLFYEIVTRFWHPHLTKIFKLDKVCIIPSE